MTDLEIKRHQRSLEAAMDELARIDGRRQQRVAAIREDVDLTEEEKRIEIDRVYREELNRHNKLKRKAVTALEAGKRLARRAQVDTKAPPEAAARVRELLSRGLAYSQVLDRAQELGDMDMVLAARTEALWHGDKDGFADAQETLDRCNTILAGHGVAFESAPARAILDFQHTARPFNEIATLAALSVDRTAKPGQINHARLSKAFATGEARVEEPNDG